ncbi:MAG: HAMP domain-containing histidine kinase [bacterium]|nr:HAMP domain-containing histidine kinase [bacterium]
MDLSGLLQFFQQIDGKTYLLLGTIFVLICIIVAQRFNKGGDTEALKYEFITIIAHKFRTPLTYVKWSASELVNNETDPYKRKTLQEIQESNEKLIKLTGTLIEITDTDTGAASNYQYETVSLCDYIKNISNPYKDVFHGKNIFFSVQCPTENIQVKIDPARLEFVLQALLENALAYSPPGRNVEVSIGKSGKNATVSVIDNGIGIDKQDMSKIFTKFYRASNAQAADTEGFGVGLYLAGTIVHRHKGTLTAQSEGLGRGCVFTLTLPTQG